MEQFLSREGYSKIDFMDRCRAAVAAFDRGEESIGVVFVELLLASAEYEGFCIMMANEAREKSC